MVDKTTTREHGRALRRALSDIERAEKDQLIIANCQSCLDWKNYKAVMVFMPIPRELEVDIWPLIRWIWERWPQISVYAPRIRGAALEAVKMTALTPTNAGTFGIVEPAGNDVLLLGQKLDIVLTPLLGFDSEGQRVGYGKGYYDRFFAMWPKVHRIGVGYLQMRIASGIAVTSQDWKLHSIITETGFDNF